MKKLNTPLLLFFVFAGIHLSTAQPFFKWYDSIPVKLETDFVKNAWAGGLNFIQPSVIDLDQDGRKDLVTFDRTGDKIRTFIRKGAPGTIDFHYDPSYEQKFPEIYSWMLLADYNCDGKEDIFCYSSAGAGFDVYKNISSPSTGLQFEKVVTQQKSAYFPNASPSTACGPVKRCNLYVSSVDVPALSDIDNDGDLDVITFDLLNGSHMLYHKNMSKELFNSCDSLNFQIANNCWGYASENTLNNTYTLFDTCKNDGIIDPEFTHNLENPPTTRHSGSCELCIDLDADGDKEFIVGDISFSNLTMLTNGGSPTKASFVKKDTTFPSQTGGTVPVDMTVFPCGYYLDVDGDGIRDLIVSPNAPNASENFNSVLYYKNNGTDNSPIFQLKQGNLLQDQMIDVGEGAYPVLFDYNNDGLIDMFIGNYGYFNRMEFEHKVALFKNTGTANKPKFELVTRDYANLSTSGLTNLAPAFGDLDGDGDPDLIIGDYSGNIHYFRNVASAGTEPNFVLTQVKLKSTNNRIIDVGDFAVPQLVDMDKDGKVDLIIGGRNGKLAYYHNTGVGTVTPQFDSTSLFFGEVNVSHIGYSLTYAHPFLFTDKGITKLLVGSQDGYLHLYDNIDGNLNGKFNLVDSTYLKIKQGTRSAPALADLNNDGYLDLVIGNYEGGVSFYMGASTINGMHDDHLIHFNFESFPNPANTYITFKINQEQNKLYLLEIYNIMGQFMGAHIVSNNLLQLDTEPMPQGMYVCKMFEVGNDHTKKTGALTKRIIIQH